MFSKLENICGDNTPNIEVSSFGKTTSSNNPTESAEWRAPYDPEKKPDPIHIYLSATLTHT